MLDTLCERLCDKNFALHGLVVPDTDPWLGSNLACCTNSAIGVHRDAMNIISVVHKMLLGVVARIHNNGDSSRVVHKLATCRVPQIVPAVMASEPINIFQI